MAVIIEDDARLDFFRFDDGRLIQAKGNGVAFCVDFESHLATGWLLCRLSRLGLDLKRRLRAIEAHIKLGEEVHLPQDDWRFLRL